MAEGSYETHAAMGILCEIGGQLYVEIEVPKLMQYICKMQNKIKLRTVLCTQNLQQQTYMKES